MLVIKEVQTKGNLELPFSNSITFWPIYSSQLLSLVIVGRYAKRFRDDIRKYSVGLLTNNNKNKISKLKTKKIKNPKKQATKLKFDFRDG